MPRQKYVFTSTAIQIIRGFAGQGKSASEIADAIGSTPASVRVKCCQLKIKLARRGRPSLQRKRPLPVPDQKLFVVSIGPGAYATLKRMAAHKKKATAEFAGMLLEAIVSADLYDAVLDGGI